MASSRAQKGGTSSVRRSARTRGRPAAELSSPAVAEVGAEKAPAEAAVGGKRKRSAVPDREDVAVAEAAPRPSKKPALEPPQRLQALADGGILVDPRGHSLDPKGSPPVWAEGRQALCEALPYYHAYQQGAYLNGGKVRGVLVAEDMEGSSLLGGEVVILRTGGGWSEDASPAETSSKRDIRKEQFEAYSWNLEHGSTIVLLVAKKNGACDLKLDHEYSVLDHFFVTDIWQEVIGGRACDKVRLQKMDLLEQGWWVPNGTPARTKAPDFNLQCPTYACKCCGNESKERFVEGWVCVHEGCELFWKVATSQDFVDRPTYSKTFLSERHQWDTSKPPAYDLVPKPREKPPGAPPTFAYDKESWDGFCCPNCRQCTQRRFWDKWKCVGESGCGYEQPVDQPVLSATEANAMVTRPRIPPAGICRTPAERQPAQLVGNWTIEKFCLMDGNYVLHFRSNRAINTAPGGTDDLFRALQTDPRMELERSKMNSKVKNEFLTKHFTRNWGYPYKYIALTKCRPFAKAPPALLDILQRLDWARKYAVPDSDLAFNEILAVGYLEKGKMSHHDDGEKHLGPTIASLSLGCDAKMTLRIKARHYTGFTGSTRHWKYHPEDPILPGAWKPEERAQLNARYSQYGEDRDEEFQALARETLKPDGRINGKRMPRTASSLIEMKLQHGDMMIMHGAEMQKYYEHAVQPLGKMRFALTARHIEKNANAETLHAEGMDWYDKSTVTPYNGATDGMPPSTAQPPPAHPPPPAAQPPPPAQP